MDPKELLAEVRGENEYLAALVEAQRSAEPAILALWEEIDRLDPLERERFDRFRAACLLPLDAPRLEP